MAWGDSFVSGLQTGSDIRDKMKRRKLDQARLDIEAEQFAKTQAQQKQLQDDRLTHDAKMQVADQTFRAGEAGKDRGFRTSERQASQEHQGLENLRDRDHRSTLQKDAQAFSGNQSQLDRDARALMQQRELDQRAQLAGAEMTFKQKGLDWEMNPENPYNKIRDSQARRLDSMADDDGSLPPTGGQFPSKLSPQDQQALDWAKANPDDPRAKQILQRLGIQ